MDRNLFHIRQLQRQAKTTCRECHGGGGCSYCHGTGLRARGMCLLEYGPSKNTRCFYCHPPGSGLCFQCGGQGYTMVESD